MRLSWKREPRTARREGERSSRVSAVMEAVSRSEAYHIAQHRSWRRVAVLAVLGQVLTVGALLAWMNMRETIYIAIATDTAGRTLPIVSAESAGSSDEIGIVLTWTVGAVTEAFTMGFHDYRRRVEGVRDRFTEDGFDSYMRVLEQSLVLQRVGEQGQVVAAVAEGAPVMSRVRRFDDGGVGYEVGFPLSLTFYEGKGDRVTERLVANALVVRMSRAERLSGVAIAQFWLARRGSS